MKVPAIPPQFEDVFGAMQTARTDLQNLQHRGFLTFRTIGRRGAWEAAQGLDKLLRQSPE